MRFLCLPACSILLALAGCQRAPLEKAKPLVAAAVSGERLRETLTRLTEKPHRAGTPANAVALSYLEAELSKAGLAVSGEPFEAFVPKPKRTQLSITAPDALELDLFEKSFPGVPSTKALETDIPFFAFVPDADLEAAVVYASFGAREDYAELRKNGIDPRGRIALVRAQGLCRSKKAEIAAEEGVVGLLLYPELRDQGFKKTPYPEGPHINPWAIQRGTFLQYYRRPGAPERDSPYLSKIPALPIGQAAADQLFRRLGGPPWGEDARGFQSGPYTMGDGGLKVRMVNEAEWPRQELRNVFGTLPGTGQDPRPLVVGAHVDAWVYGAVDPASGAAVVLEAARVLAELRKKGLALARPVTFAFWDGEELGMFGSTRWVLEHAEKTRPIAYLNVDSAVRNTDFVGNVSPGLRGPLDDVLKLVADPNSGEPLYVQRGTFGKPGFSSDTSPFSGFSPVPVSEIGFGRWYGLYHTGYDDLHFYERHMDKGLVRTKTLANVLALYILNLAGSEVLPYRFDEIGAYFDEQLAELSLASESVPASLRSALAAYRKTAAAWDARRPQAAPAANDALSAAMAAFWAGEREKDAPEPFGACALLFGPSPAEGCASEALPGLARALRAKDAAAIAAESQRLVRALDESAASLARASR
ncbi:MAG: M20/M25/M40 family metallo-hydrolase [Acidobacteria bacterium]|nr:M20/M25/M40 family metallo-hydrolase [Acidobacteriota bacterium]